MRLPRMSAMLSLEQHGDARAHAPSARPPRATAPTYVHASDDAGQPPQPHTAASLPRCIRVRSSLMVRSLALGIVRLSPAADARSADAAAATPSRTCARTAARSTTPLRLARFATRCGRYSTARCADSAFPGAIAVVGTRSRVIAAVRRRPPRLGAESVPDEHTLWDLASLTKVVGLTSGDDAARRRRARSTLDAPVQRYLPAWTGRTRSASRFAICSRTPRACRRSSRTTRSRTTRTASRS